MNILRKILIFIIALSTTILVCEFTLRKTDRLPFSVNEEQKKFWEFDEVLGWKHRPNQKGFFEKPQFNTSIEINSKGLRDDEHTYRRPHPSKKRVLVLGDSFAWGFGVEKSERFSELLEQQLNVEVINAGVSGYSTDQEFLWYKYEGYQYEVDLVVLLFCGNDESDNYKDKNYFVYNKPSFSLNNGKLVDTKKTIRKANVITKASYYLMQKSSFYYQFVKAYLLIIKPKLKVKAKWEKRSNRDKNFLLTHTIIQQLQEEVNNQDTAFLIYATPRYWFKNEKKEYLSFLEQLNTNFPGKVIAENFNPNNYVLTTIHNNLHWNATGHKMVSQQIHNYIIENQLFSDAKK